MNEDKMRAEFEAWITSAPFEKSVHRNPESSGFPGQYRAYEVQLAWEAWQASRAALEVELPMIDISLSSCRTDEWCEGVVHATEKYRDAIEASGVRVRA